ncbi:MAG: hypothetical protein NVS9B15_03760 [Acidobacteriaceae bacterium]
MLQEHIARELMSLAVSIWWLIALSFGYGVITMAVVELLKDQFWRCEFNRAQIESRLVEPERRKELVELAVSGDSQALYDLTIEKLAGQISAALMSAMEYPQRHAELIRLFAQGADEEDLSVLQTVNTSLRSKKPEEFTEEDQSAMVAYSDARTRVAHRIQRFIDSLQISVGEAWRRKLQRFSFAISVVLGAVFVFYLRRTWPGMGLVTLSLATAVLGGFLAPLVKDVVSRAQAK